MSAAAESSARIDPRAVVDPAARLAEDVAVAPFAVIGQDVEIGPGCTVGAHAVVQGPTRIGRGNRIFPFASLGTAPQDLKYRGGPTWLEIGDDNTFREFCTINRGTEAGGGVTAIGDHNLFMAYVHVAHDCRIGSHVVFANNASLAGHVQVDDHVVLGGFTAVAQFLVVGAHAFTAAGSVVNRHIPPYVLASGQMARAIGVNVEGLKRRGFAPSAIQALRRAFKTLYLSGGALDEALERLRAPAREHADVAQLLAFIEQRRRGKMGILCR